MAFKGNCSCYDNAAADEPIFVLRAHDRLAPRVVEYSAELARAFRDALDKAQQEIVKLRCRIEELEADCKTSCFNW